MRRSAKVRECGSAGVKNTHTRLHTTPHARKIRGVRKFYNPKEGFIIMLSTLIKKLVLPILIAVFFFQAVYAAEKNEVDKRLRYGLERAAQFAVYPSSGEVYAKVDFDRQNVRVREAVEFGSTVNSVEVFIRPQASNTILAKGNLKISKGKSDNLKLALPEITKQAGKYDIVFIFDRNGEKLEFTLPFERQIFSWEGNKLGLDDSVPAPFEPVKATDSSVQVVLRQMKINGYGLFDSIIANGKELLAAPMTLRYETADGQMKTIPPGNPKLAESVPDHATHTGKGGDDAIAYEVRSTTEIDGMTKVEMSLLPGLKPTKVNKLWIDIPLKNSEMPLMHETVDGPRISHAGTTPDGQGRIWISAQSKRYLAWQNTFTPYIWLGSEVEGFAWFAENDRGWLTAKGGSKEPVQELIRNGDTLTLRIYLINQPSTIQKRQDIVFGIQSSPTKPMPANWRAEQVNIPSCSGPVVPWGGIHCASMYPYKNDWRIVEVIQNSIKKGEIDKAGMEQLAKELNPPKVFGDKDWVWMNDYFAKRYVKTDLPPMVYSSENSASQVSDEWKTFQDEWGLNLYTPRQWPDWTIFAQGSNQSPSVEVNSAASYRDFAAWVQDQWLQRGIGIYWDNNRARVSFNPRNSAAYFTENGSIQPAVGIWNLRELHKRVYKILAKHRQTYGPGLHWSCHMTNALLLPLHSWATVILDNEDSKTDVFDPAFVRTESTGFQVGAQGYSLKHLYGENNAVVKALPENQKAKISWGMRMVHELARCGAAGGSALLKGDRRSPDQEKLIRNFGYGSDDVKVTNYWDRNATVKVSPENVKWIMMEHKDGRKMYVLSSYSVEPVKAAIEYASEQPTKNLADAETGESLGSWNGNKFEIPMPAPYGVRIIEVK